MSKPKPKLKHGWKYIEDDPPPDCHKVLVTNNIKALNAHGDMSHIWISFVIKSSDMVTGFRGFDRDIKLNNLVAWHALPKKAV